MDRLSAARCRRDNRLAVSAVRVANVIGFAAKCVRQDAAQCHAGSLPAASRRVLPHLADACDLLVRKEPIERVRPRITEVNEPDFQHRAYMPLANAGSRRCTLVPSTDQIRGLYERDRRFRVLILDHTLRHWLCNLGVLPSQTHTSRKRRKMPPGRLSSHSKDTVEVRADHRHVLRQPAAPVVRRLSAGGSPVTSGRKCATSCNSSKKQPARSTDASGNSLIFYAFFIPPP
jgi:hypothetical protein